MGTTIAVGERYAYREPPDTWLKELIPVEVIKLGPTPRFAKVRIRWLGGEWEGLDTWVPKRRLLVPWSQAERFLDDERRMVEALDATEDTRGTVEHDAVDHVFGAVGVAVFGGYQQILTGLHAYDDNLLTIPAFEATVKEYGLDTEALLHEAHAFVDRNGDYWAPYAVARSLAREFCRRHGRDLLDYFSAEEDALREASVSGHYRNR